MKNRKFWNWINQSDENAPAERVLELNGTIAEESWFDDDVTPAMFKDELFSGSGPITVWINSPGGDCIAASQIYTMLMDYKGDVTVKIDGVAASAASVVAMAGTKVLIAPTALMMIHNPATMAFGDHADMEKAIDMLSEVKESIINAYELKTSLSRRQLWVLWGAGKVPVGVDSSDSDFSTVEKTGGAKTVTLAAANMPSHNHALSRGTVTVTAVDGHTHQAASGTYKVGSGSGSYYKYFTNGGSTGPATTGSGGGHTHTATLSGNTGSKGSGTAHNNVQPYITCYFYKRTA